MVDMDKIVSLSKRRGFIFQSSEIYGGLGSAWDYGPLGVELKNNVKRLWWRDNVHLRDDMVGLDAAITMHPKVWEASGHLASFSDPFTGCLDCGRHYRADHVEEARKNSKWWQRLMEVRAKGTWSAVVNWVKGDGKKLAPNLASVKQAEDICRKRFLSLPPDQHQLSESEFLNEIGGSDSICPSCGGKLSEPRPAGLMLETSLGPVQETAIKVYLRPETAQGIFVNFDNVLQASRKKLPFGIAQIGKAFRNEITPGNFTFRTREFEQMEIEFFCDAGHGRRMASKVDRRALCMVPALRHTQRKTFDCASMNRTSWRTMPKRCVDIEYLFPMGWSELEGIANRTDYDLKQHSQYSGKALEYFDEESKQKIIPYVIEPSAGADRSTLAFLVDAYHEEEVRGEKRVVLKFHPELAPIKIAVLPLLKKNDRIVETAKKLTADLRRALVRCLRRHGIHRSSLSAPRRSGHAFLRYRRRPDGGRRESAGG